MGYRGRIVPNVSYFYVHSKGLGKGEKQEERAAELVRAVVEFKKLADRWAHRSGLPALCLMEGLLMGVARCLNRRRSRVDRYAWLLTSTCTYALQTQMSSKAD